MTTKNISARDLNTPSQGISCLSLCVKALKPTRVCTCEGEGFLYAYVTFLRQCFLSWLSLCLNRNESSLYGNFPNKYANIYLSKLANVTGSVVVLCAISNLDQKFAYDIGMFLQ